MVISEKLKQSMGTVSDEECYFKRQGIMEGLLEEVTLGQRPERRESLPWVRVSLL